VYQPKTLRSVAVKRSHPKTAPSLRLSGPTRGSLDPREYRSPHSPNGISVGSTVYGFCNVRYRYWLSFTVVTNRHTDIHTDHATSAAVGHTQHQFPMENERVPKIIINNTIFFS